MCIVAEMRYLGIGHSVSAMERLLLDKIASNMGKKKSVQQF